MDKERYNEIIESSEFVSQMRGKLEHIRRFLHQGKASVMVGAGFSRNAEKAPDVEIKDWAGLAVDFYKKLYCNDPEQSDLALRSPLRLASQVEAQYGRNELNSVIENAVPDDKVKPGPLHNSLVKLPWKDIFTTNYDTLIERTKASDIYSVVTNKKTLLYKSSKRIIKLHGSYPNVKPYIINEEDYRTYPDKFAEFVNTVRQSLIESILCLVGFSGDDPNFLKWIGWVRDKMGDDLAPIYMFEVSENGLHESEIALYRQRNIVVIPMLNSLFHGNITDYFEFIFQFLSEKPFDVSEKSWKPDIEYSEISSLTSIEVSEDNGVTNTVHANKIKDLIQKYRSLRSSYPGWLFMPVTHLENAFEDKFAHELGTIHGILGTIDAETKIDLLYELEWRIRMSFIPMSLIPWMTKAIETIINSYESAQIVKDVRLSTLSIALLSAYRQRLNEKEFTTLRNKISGITNTSDLDNIRRYYYETCLYAVSLLNYHDAERILAVWMPSTGDYLGILWKSAMLTEIGKEDDAYSLLEKTYQLILDNAVSASNTALINSAKAAYESVMTVFTPFSRNESTRDKEDNDFRIYKYFRYEKSQLQDQREKRLNAPGNRQRSHNFNLNEVVNHLNMDSPVKDTETRFAGRLQMVWEMFGYPFLLGSMTVNSSIMELSCDSLFMSENGKFALTALIRSAQDSTIKKLLSKERVMSLDRGLIQLLFADLVDKAENISDWSVSSQFNRRMAIIVTHILCRFSVALDDESIAKIFPILLKIREERPANYKRDFLQTLYNNLSIKQLEKLVPQIAEAPIETESRDDVLPFPNIETRTSEVNISDKAIAIIREGFNSEKAETRENTYLRVTHIYEYCNDEQKAELNELIVSWREKDIKGKINATFSFNLVDVQDGETITPDDRLKYAIERIVEISNKDDSQQESKYHYVRNVDESLYIFEALYKRIKQEDVPTILSCFNSHLQEIINSIQADRSPLMSFFDNSSNSKLKIISTVIAHLCYDDVDKSSVESLLDKYITLLKKEYPRFFAIAKLNEKANTITDDEFKSNLRSMVFSTNERARGNALAYLSSTGFEKYSAIWQDIWLKIEYCSSPEVVDYISAVLDACDKHELDISGIHNLKDIFITMRHNLHQYDMLSGDVFDIEYQMMRLSGYVSQCNPSEDLSTALSAWTPGDDTDLLIPRDVLLGYEDGKRIWTSFHEKSSKTE